MKNQKHYIMCDQVDNLVPTLMNLETPSWTNRLRSWLQLAAFGLATACYLTAIALTA